MTLLINLSLRALVGMFPPVSMF